MGGRGGSSGIGGGAGGVVQYEIKEFSKDKQQFIINQFNKLLKEYPLGPDVPELKVVGTREKFGLSLDMEDYDVEDTLYERGIDQERYMSQAYFDGRGELIINDTGFNKSNSIEDSIDHMNRLRKETGPQMGLFKDMAGYGGEYVAAHEYAHILARSYDMYGGQKGARELVSYWNNNKDKIARDLGGYSTMNWNEAFAEAFAQSRYKRGQSQSSKDMMEIFNRQMKKVKRK